MTDMLVAPAEAEDGQDYLSCGCCIAPPVTVTDQVAVLEARRDALERRLQGLPATR